MLWKLLALLLHQRFTSLADCVMKCFLLKILQKKMKHLYIQVTHRPWCYREGALDYLEIVALYLKGTCDVVSVTMAMHKVHKSVLEIFSFCKLSEKLIRWPTIFIYFLESSLNYLLFRWWGKKLSSRIKLI